MSMTKTQTLEDLTNRIAEQMEFALYQAAMHAEYGDESNEGVDYTTLADRLAQALGCVIGSEHALDEYEYFVRKANRRVHGD